MTDRNVHGNLSPLDFRYWEEEASKYLSDAAFHRYKLDVEIALVATFSARGICTDADVEEIVTACAKVTPDEVAEEEHRIKHDIRALVNCIQKRVSDRARRFVHLSATSYDVIDTARAVQYRDACHHVLIPQIEELLAMLIHITEREAETPQIGRTHGQHAVPITFGFAVASFVSRLGGCLLEIRQRANRLPGKFSGAVGAYNASSLIVSDAVTFETEVLEKLSLAPAEHSTQIAPPEPLLRLLSEIVAAAGVMANVARDMRNLQRSEINEVGEAVSADQVGSSTMPHKRNPISFENVESMWKVVVPRLMTVFLDQVSDHQRDLTNSASARTYGEIIAYVSYMAKRLTAAMKKLVVDRDALRRNCAMNAKLVAAEKLYILLAREGHPDAHEAVRKMTRLLLKDPSATLYDLAWCDSELRPYLERMTPNEKMGLNAADSGLAPDRALEIAKLWRGRLTSAADTDPPDPDTPL